MQVKFVNEQEDMVAEVSCDMVGKGYFVGTVVYKGGEFQKKVGAFVQDNALNMVNSAISSLEAQGFTIVEEI